MQNLFQPFPIQKRAHVMADRGAAKVHTYIAPCDANATHIIESANALVLIDGQMLVPFATEFRTY